MRTPGTLAGLSAYSGRDDALGILTGDGKILIYVRENKKHRIVKTVNAPQTSLLYLRMSVTEGWRYRFAYSTDGRDWKELEGEINGSFLEGVRVALTAGGGEGAAGNFEWLRVTPAR